MRMPPRCLVSVAGPVVLGLLAPSVGRAAAPPAVRQLRTQQVGDVTYFHVRLDAPHRLTTDGQPRLIPQDARSRLVVARVGSAGPERPGFAPPPVEIRPAPGGQPPEGPRGPVPVVGLEFVGVAVGNDEAAFILQYPTEGRHLGLDRLRPRNMPVRPHTHWTAAALTLNFAKADRVKVPAEAEKRRTLAGKPPPNPNRKEAAPTPLPQPPVADDLQGLWAAAQADEFARLATEAHDFPFYTFAAQATARKFGIPTPGLAPGMVRLPQAPDFTDRQLFETTTGATAITESLQLQRMLNANVADDTRRTVAVDSIQGIDIAEHPWEKMMAGNKPDPEPLAHLVPADNYYVTFKNVRKLLEFNELLEQWGTSLIRAYEVHSRDYLLKEHYQRQLCIESTPLAKTLGPLVLRGVAITGHDAYLREGSDVTILFHVANRSVFLSAVNRFLDAARNKYGDQLQQGKEEYRGVMVESYVTPRREVSLHRAVFDDFVVYSNSPAGLRRVLDAHKGKIKALADSLDFQYMRTIFRAGDKDEDGFVFLSDPFIRQLVGPASKIKEKRRLEALASMYMLNEGALYTAWTTGKPPADRAALLASAGLRAEEVPQPEGKPLTWDAQRQTAFSDVCNTIEFATPLVELDIDKVTPREAEAYRQFRLQYLGLWRQYFDPIGMRIAVGEQQVKLDTYILPLIQNSHYNELRRVTGDGTLTLEPGKISSRTVAQFLMHLSPNLGDRRAWLRGFVPGEGPGAGGDTELMEVIAWAFDPVGKWFLVRLDDSPVFAKLAALLDREDGLDNVDGEEVTRLVFQIPIVVGLDVKNSLTFGGLLAAARREVSKALPGGLTWEPLEQPYKGVPIVRIQATPRGMQRFGVSQPRPGKEPFLPAVYYAMIDGAFYLTPSEALLRDLIDRAQDKGGDKAGAVEVNSSLYLSPAAAQATRSLVEKYLEAQVRQQALANEPIWYALYHAGVVPADADVARAREAAERWLGFVPAGPDGAAYTYDRKADEVINQRHGTLRRPKENRTLAEDSPLARLLDSLKSVRADLRFREDGIHTVLTVDRQYKKD
jgi:hypothetical protein